MPGLSLAPEQKAAHGSWESQGDYCQCTMEYEKKDGFCSLGDLTHTGIIISLPTLVSPHWRVFVVSNPPLHPPLASLTGGISSVNPCRNVASAMERMPIVCPARLAASKRTKVRRSVNHALTVPTSTASRRPTAPAPAMLCAVNACLGKSSYSGSLTWFF